MSGQTNVADAPLPCHAFKTTAEVLPWDDVAAPANAFSVSCASCGSGTFDLTELSEIDAGPVGLSTTCRGCGREQRLFHALYDGYDGVHGHLDFITGEQAGAPLLDRAGRPVRGAQLLVVFTYNVEPDELAELAVEAGCRPADLFDWFQLLHRTDTGRPWAEVWDYECA
jgi:hypothetical protein